MANTFSNNGEATVYSALANARTAAVRLAEGKSTFTASTVAFFKIEGRLKKRAARHAAASNLGSG